MKKKRNVPKKKVVMMNAKEREDMKGKMINIKQFFMMLSNDPKLGLDEGDDRVRDKMMTGSGRILLGNTDDDGGQYDRVRDKVCADDRGLPNKVSGNTNNTNLLCTETGWGEVVCVRG